MNLKMQVTPVVGFQGALLISPNPFAAQSWKFKVGVDFGDFTVQILHGTCENTELAHRGISGSVEIRTIRMLS